mmetsp:Transcript_105297/g.166246  ORF Transcript_105297/g.166246 Transcript_105297/m.166246 type:complete len:245 (+) Transcript_105297:86-820(+)
MKRLHGCLLWAMSCHSTVALIVRHAGVAGDMRSPSYTNPADDYFSAVYGPMAVDEAPDEFASQREGPPLTDDGMPEQPTHLIGWLAPTGQSTAPETECNPHCLANDYCWHGKCIYRPWEHYNTIRASCYPDPEQLGLSHQEQLACRSAGAIFSMETCEGSASYCKWLNDAPKWYRGIANAWESLDDAKWKKEQEELKESFARNKVAREAIAYAHPGNPVVGSVISPPERRFYIDPEHIEGHDGA